MASFYLRRFRPVIVALSALVLALASVLTVAAAPPPWAGRHVCAVGPAATARCHAIVRTDIAPQAAGPNVTPAGYGPADLRAAYNLASSGSSSTTIAIVDAFDNPNAESDLAVYRSQFGLPPCTTANGCFRKVNQNGGTSYPAGNVGWGEEIALDIDMASAICPNCHILLVEANDNSFVNLGAAVDRAATMGANAISNSYGGGEFSVEGTSTYNGHFNHPGHAITVSSGDSGYGVEFPAASQYVTAVGGTSLTRASNARGWSETVWSGAGSGCSAYIAKPSWQTDTGCNRRTVADVAAVADPGTGVAVYDTYGTGGGWLVFGGTSVAAPIIAGVYALAGNTSSINDGSYSYRPGVATDNLFDVTSGSNGNCVRGKRTAGAYLCRGVPGYDGPTGNGTPKGTGAF